MTEKKKELEVVFAPGCFDDFEGTQEELDEFIAEIKASFADGSFMEKSVALEDLSDEEYEELTEQVESVTSDPRNRTLQ